MVAISASSDSQCILRALEYGASIGCRTVALTGSDGRQGKYADITVHVGSTEADTLEDARDQICHMIGSYFLDFDLCCSYHCLPVGGLTNCKAVGQIIASNIPKPDTGVKEC